MSCQVLDDADAILGAAFDFWKSAIRSGYESGRAGAQVEGDSEEIGSFSERVGSELWEKAKSLGLDRGEQGSDVSPVEDLALMSAIEDFAEATSILLSQSVKSLAASLCVSPGSEFESQIRTRNRDTTDQIAELTRQIRRITGGDSEVSHRVAIELGTNRASLSLEEAEEGHAAKWGSELKRHRP